MRAFSRPTRLVEPSGITPGKSAGHSGLQLVSSLRIAIRTTITSRIRFQAPTKKASTRFHPAPGPQKAYRRHQYGNVKNGQTTTLSAKTDQRAIGDMNDESPGMSGVATRANPKKTRSTPTPIQRRTRVAPRPEPNRPKTRAARPSPPDTSAPTVLDGNSAQPKSVTIMQTTASTTVTIVAPGFAVIASASVATPAAVTAMALTVPRMASSGSLGSVAPSRTAAIGGTIVARKAG